MMAESSIGLRLCGSHVLTNRSAACDYMETRTEQNYNFKVNVEDNMEQEQDRVTNSTNVVSNVTVSPSNNNDRTIVQHEGVEDDGDDQKVDDDIVGLSPCARLGDVTRLADLILSK
ncbi:MAG: hypothetical protein ACI8RD_003112 [Bacillariaceae sp.]|jgi:hypothetical protein